MRDQFRSLNDLPAAEEWLINHLLNRQSTVSDRLVHSTKLTDLIYQGFSFEDVYADGDRNEYPVHTNPLVADLFGALFSPVIRLRDDHSVYHRERFFNKPVLEYVMRDDRFDTLKSLCEDKELTSYEAASVFAKTLEAALENKPYHPKADYLQIIRVLKSQVEKIVTHLQTACLRHPKKRLHLCNCVYNKLSQIYALEKKLAEEALCYLQTIGKDIGNAIDAALQSTLEVHCVMSAWGTGAGEMKNTPVNRELIKHVKNSETLLQIAQTLGKYREIVADKRKNSFAYGRGEKYDLTIGNDMSNCLSSELALLGSPETEILFMRKYEQKRLLQYRKRTQIIKGKGDMIVLLDESSSTQAVRAWAKAFALALLDIAARDNCKFALVHFSSARQIRTDLFEPGHYSSDDILKAAEHFFNGGTNFETPLKEAISLMEKGYENADITIITDGECELSDKSAEKLLNAIRQYKATITGILLDKDNACGSSLLPFCDKVYHSKDITEDEIAVRILNSKAS